MNAITRARLEGLAAGAALVSLLAWGLAIGRVGAADRRASAAERKAQEAIERANDGWRASLAAHESKEAALTEEVRACSAEFTLARDQQNARAGWYTVLYEDQVDAPVASPQPSGIELLNLVRPGLGTALAKLQSQRPASDGVHHLVAKWVIPGQVHPVMNPDHGFALPYQLPEQRSAQ